VSEEFVGRALDNADVAGIVTTRELYNLSGWPRFDGWIISDDPQADFFRFHNWLWISTTFYSSFESEYEFVGSQIHIYSKNTRIDEGVYIEPGATIGYSGARFVYSKEDERIDVIHAGGVHICEGAHIGANAVIVKSVWPLPTRIGKNAFIGNLVNVGHNVQVGDGAAIMSGAILGGSCIIGERATIGLGAIVRPHVKIGVGAKVSMGAVVTQDVPPHEWVTGNFAVEHGRFMRRVKKWSES
jgi:UDP-3-O-[3-hydroxymyristoyl] glucosamine N-acyltransferase